MHHIFEPGESKTYENSLPGAGDVAAHYLVMVAVDREYAFSEEIEVEGDDGDSLVDVKSRDEIYVSLDIEIPE